MIDVTINVRDSKGLSLEIHREFPFGTVFFETLLAELIDGALKDVQKVSEGVRSGRKTNVD